MSVIPNLSLSDVALEQPERVQVGVPRLLLVLTTLTLIGIGFGLYMALGFAKADANQGEVQRIFYIHMPAFIGAFVAFAATTLGGFMYLRTRKTKWDTLALAGVEVGLVLAAVNLVTGMIWAKPIWNTWWTWDPRLTLEAIMMLTYAAYFVLRASISNAQTRRRFASVYGMLAIILVIMVIMISRIKPDTIHPTVFGPSSQQARGTFQLD
ncbi:MAG: cytochrome c biogenesis protein CcsA, partial [Anaerolineae bacterium]|nr:cytochrome c biogenesis protein CcsA [Anaerolineae bacterium]